MDVEKTRISYAPIQSMVGYSICMSHLAWQTADEQFAAIMLEDSSLVVGPINYDVCSADLMERLDRAIACGRPIAVDVGSRLCPVVIVDELELGQQSTALPALWQGDRDERVDCGKLPNFHRVGVTSDRSWRMSAVV